MTGLPAPGATDGLDPAREARRRRRRRPAVRLAGPAAFERPSAAGRSGPFSLLRKPATAEHLAGRLARLPGGAAMETAGG